MRVGETVFLLAVVLVLAVAVAVPFVAASPEQQERVAPDANYTVEPPDVPEESGTATVGGETFDSVTAAANNATAGDEIVLEGSFEEQVQIATADITLVGGDRGAVIDGRGDGDVVEVTAKNVTLADVWIRNSGSDTDEEHAGIFLGGDANGASLEGVHLTDVLFGVWVNGADEVTITDSYVQGRAEVTPMVERGNGIHLWETKGTVIRDNTIVTVRDGIYYSWAKDVFSENNTMAHSRYGVHFMYSDNNRMVDNTAVNNDVGYALMISEGLELVDNEALWNSGASGHGVMIKEVDYSEIHNNTVVENEKGFYIYNSNGNGLTDNLIASNDLGIHSTAGSERQTVVGNSFIDNDEPARTPTQDLKRWNGNYWSEAQPVDTTGDGVSNTRYRPAGIVDHLIAENPQAAVFAESPAFDTIRVAESSFPVIESPGIVDQEPLMEPTHGNWTEYTRDSNENNG